MSDQNAIKIVVDTNLWISLCIGIKLSSLVEAIINKKVVLCFSHELYDEIFTVLKRPQIRAVIKEERVKELHNLLAYRADVVSPSGSINDCRDPKDNFLLDLALSADAQYLITGDSDLLALNPFHSVTIVKAHEFERIINDLNGIA